MHHGLGEVIARSCFAAEALAEMPCFALHADYHSGNLKYHGLSVVGVFDFDDAKVDYRVFDIALALANMCTSWDAAEDGDYLRWVRHHLRAMRFIETHRAGLDETLGLGPAA